MTITKRVWRGDAVAVAQVVTITPGTVTTGYTYSLRINGKDINVVASNNTAATLVADFVTAISASRIPEWREVTATAASGVLTLTSRTAGIPFKVSALVGGFEQSGAIVITVANQPTGGTWNFDAGDYGDDDIAYNASASTVQTSMDSLFGSGNTTVTKYNSGTRVIYQIDFTGTFTGEAVPGVTVSYANLTGGNAAVAISGVQEAVAGTSEVQVVTFYGSPSGGSSYWTFEGVTSAAIAHNASAATVQSTLRAMSSIGSGNIAVSGSSGGPYTCTFQGALAHKDVSLLSVDASGLTGGSIYAALTTMTDGIAGTNETQYLRAIRQVIQDESFGIAKTGTVSGGTFRIKVGSGSVYTSAIAYNATAAAIAAALETAVITYLAGATTEGTGLVQPVYDGGAETVAGGNCLIRLWGSMGGVDYDIENDGNGQTLLLTMDGASLTGGGSYSLNFTTLHTDGANYNGNLSLSSSYSFKLQFGSETTSTLTTASTAAQVQSALEALSNVGSGNVLVEKITGTSTDSLPSIGLWKVTFVGALAGTNVGKISVTSQSASMTTDNIAIDVCVRNNGVAGTNEVQRLTMYGSPSHGGVTLAYGSETSGTIAYNDSASTVQTTMLAMTAFATGDIVTSGGALPGTAVDFTYGGQYQYTNVPALVLNDNGLKVAVTVTTPGVTGYNEKIKLSLADQQVWGGTATLTYNSHTTGSLDWDSTASEVQAAFIALSDFVDGDVVCTGGPWPETDIYAEFEGNFAETDVSAVTSTSSLKNGVVTAVSYDPMIVEKTTEATGPNHFSEPTNWYNPDTPTEYRAPERDNAVYFTDGKIDCLYGLTQQVTFTVDTSTDYLIPSGDHDLKEGQKVGVWTSNTLPSGLAAATTYYVRNLSMVTGKFQLATTPLGDAVNITSSGTGTHTVGMRYSKILDLASYTGKVGLPWMNSGGYKEYRPLDLKCGLTPDSINSECEQLVTIGQGIGNGSNCFNLNLSDHAGTVEVLNSGRSSDSKPAVHLLLNNASTDINVYGGDVGVAMRPGETSTFGDLVVRGGTVSLGEVAFATIDKTGGSFGLVNQATISGVTQIRS